MKNIIAGIIDGILKYLTYKKRFEDKLDAVLSRQNDSERRLLRLEILDAMRRDDKAVVHQLYDEYKAMGGNSYLLELYKDYCKKPNKRSKK